MLCSIPVLQNEYKRGISGWNFNLEDMKAQASLVHVMSNITLSYTHQVKQNLTMVFIYSRSTILTMLCQISVM